MACVGKVCLCLAHQDSTRSGTQCLVNVTCNSDLLMFSCVFEWFLGGACACVCKCVEAKGHPQLPYVPQELSNLLLETGPLIFTWNSQGSSWPQFSCAGYKCKPASYTPAHTTYIYARIQMIWRSHQMAGLVRHSSSESSCCWESGLLTSI